MSSEVIIDIAQEAEEVKRKNNFAKFLIVFLVLILTIDTLSYLLLRTDDIVALYQKGLFFIVLITSVCWFFKWNKPDRTCFYLFLLLLMKMIAESLIGYGSVLIYPSILAVMSPFLYVYFIKNLFKKLNIDIFKVMIFFIFIGYFVFMLFNGHDFDFSNTLIPVEDGGPFSGDTRILHANSILLLVLPYLYFLNQLLSSKKTQLTVPGLLVSLLIILIHQHRTVWVVTIFSSVMLLFMKGINRSMIKRLLVFVLILIVVFIALVVAVPGISDLLVERFADVLNPLDEENTGGFRYLQILAYLNYFIQKPFFGWTFSGFELPNAFMDDNWEEGSGHHFHNSYIEVLFYFGITGLLLKYYPLYSIARKMKNRLSDRSMILAAFCVSGFLYSFSYVPPLFFWGIVGLCLYYIEKDMAINDLNESIQEDE